MRGNYNQHYEMRYGDRVFVRVDVGQRCLCNLCLEDVATMSEVIGRVRHALRSHTGVVKMSVRNYHRGWCKEQHLRLYGDFPAPRHNAQASAGNSHFSRQCMLMPWETH